MKTILNKLCLLFVMMAAADAASKISIPINIDGNTSYLTVTPSNSSVFALDGSGALVMTAASSLNATHTGDATGSTALTLATVNSNVGSFGSSTHYTSFTVNAKGLITAAAQTAWPTFNQSTTGNAATATVWANGRTIAITGDITYTSPSFDGSGNVTAAGTLATVNSNVGSFTNGSFTVNAKGLITAASSGAAPEVPLTFSTGLTRTTNTITVNASQTQITGVGTLTTGTWNASVIPGLYGGTGVANSGKTITLAGNLVTTGAFNTTFAQAATTTITLPSTSATMARTDAAQSFTGTQTIPAGQNALVVGQNSGADDTDADQLSIKSRSYVGNKVMKYTDRGSNVTWYVDDRGRMSVNDGGVPDGTFAMKVGGAVFITGPSAGFQVMDRADNAKGWQFYSNSNTFRFYKNHGTGNSEPFTISDAGTVDIPGMLKVATKTPASASATGETGTICWDASYIYICTATNAWKRVAIATW